LSISSGILGLTRAARSARLRIGVVAADPPVDVWHSISSAASARFSRLTGAASGRAIFSGLTTVARAIDEQQGRQQCCRSNPTKIANAESQSHAHRDRNPRADAKTAVDFERRSMAAQIGIRLRART